MFQEFALWLLQWGPVGGDNPAFPDGLALLGLAIAGVGGVATALGVTWLASDDRDGEYPARDERSGRLSPITLSTFGIVLLVAGLYLLFAG